MNHDHNLDRLADEFENDWRRDSRPSIPEYLARLQFDLRILLAELLIPIDAEYRTKAGERVSREDYLDLGSQIEPVVDRCLQSLLGNPTAKTTNDDLDAKLSSPDLMDNATIPPSGNPAGDFEGESNPTLAQSSSAKLSDSKWIGRYKLLQKIGEGGMGTVWMAEQAEPVRRRVALKVIKAGLDTKQVIARFEAERQAIAMMDHQNIAKILDAGTTDDGRPYFVMELVKGVPFNEYCDQNRLSIKDRLELFIPVCKAVQHAHQKGIIHRDLKPSNVLISLYDGQPVPKIIDFGLAKALDQQSKLTDRTMFTEFGQVLGTLQYMSPEQAEMNALDVDTRTDIYSLGVMLYELLTGSTPIEKATLQQNALLQILAVIREKDPPRPSVRLSSHTNEAVIGISAQRQIDSNKLKNILRGDLDWIVMKALEKNRTRRYETANGFGEDIERYLQGDAVEARPPSASYRVNKFVHKNRNLVASVAVITGLLVLGIFGTTYGMLWAFNETTRANSNEASALEEARNARAAEESVKTSKAKTEETLARSNFFLALARWDSSRVREANEYLNKVPPVFRNLEWNLAYRRFRGSDLTCIGHLGKVTCVSLSSQGNQIASGSDDNTIKLWDAKSGQEIRSFMGHTKPVTSVSFSPDCQRVVSGSQDSTINVWNVNTGKKVLEPLIGHSFWVLSVAFSPDGRMIASGGEDNTVKIWDAASGKLLRSAEGHSGFVTCVCFSSDNNRVASTSLDSTIKVWDANTGELKHTLQGHEKGVLSACFSPDDSQIVSAGWDKSIRVWDVSTARQLRIIKVDPVSRYGRIKSVRYSPDGKWIVSASDDGIIRICDAVTGEIRSYLKGHEDSVNSVCFCLDGNRLVSGSDDHSIKIWNFDRGEEYATLEGHTRAVNGVSFNSDGSILVSGSDDQTIKVWDVSNLKVLNSWEAHPQPISSVAFSSDGRTIGSASGAIGGYSDNTVRTWNIKTGEQLVNFEGHVNQFGRVNQIAFSPDGKLIASGSEDESVIIWDVISGTKKARLRGQLGVVTCLSFGHDGELITSGSDNKSIFVWNVRTENVEAKFVGSSGISSIDFFGSRIATGNLIGEIQIWDIGNGIQPVTLKGHTNVVGSVKFSEDGTRIVSGSDDQTIKIWDSYTGQELMTLTGHTSAVTSVTISRDNTMIASGSRDNTIKLWDARTFD